MVVLIGFDLETWMLKCRF